jgi:hypothetical protein
MDEILKNVLVLNSIILAVLYLRNFKVFGRPYRLFTLYLSMVAAVQIGMWVYASFEWNNLFMSHFYFIGQFIIISLFYKELLSKKLILWVLGSVLLTLALQYTLNPSVFFVFNSYGMSSTQTILVLYAFLYFQKSLTTKSAYLYINAGIFFYLITSILYFASYNLFLELKLSDTSIDYISRLHQILYLIFEILIFLEWYQNFRLAKSHVPNT